MSKTKRPSDALTRLVAWLPARLRLRALISIGVLVVALVGALAGQRIYAHFAAEREAEISLAFWNLTSLLAAEELEQAEEQFVTIRDNGSEQQFVHAALAMASGYVAAERYAEAELLYQRVIELGEMSVIRDLARLRLAKAQLAQDKIEQSRDTLVDVEQRVPHVGVVLNALLGDIALAENNLLSSQASYQAALAAAQALGNTSYGQLLREKLALVKSLLLQQST